MACFSPLETIQAAVNWSSKSHWSPSQLLLKGQVQGMCRALNSWAYKISLGHFNLGFNSGVITPCPCPPPQQNVLPTVRCRCCLQLEGPLTKSRLPHLGTNVCSGTAAWPPALESIFSILMLYPVASCNSFLIRSNSVCVCVCAWILRIFVYIRSCHLQKEIVYFLLSSLVAFYLFPLSNCPG